MASSPTPYGSASIAALRSRTEYEAWLLEAVYSITDRRLAVEGYDELIYKPDGSPATQVIACAGALTIGDWRPGFLDAGAPLVFVSAFKLLDMVAEWVLAENGRRPTYRFAQKIMDLGGGITFPDLLETRPWLRARLVAMYERLEPFRGTIIHDRQFKSASGDLQISGSRSSAAGLTMTLTAIDLRNLAQFAVSIVRYLEGTWTIDTFREKRLRRLLDDLAFLHGEPSLGQLVPGFLTVRIFVPEQESIQCDLGRIRRDIATKRPDQDVMFDLRVITVLADGSPSGAYLIGWNDLEHQPDDLRLSLGQLAPKRVDLPDDLVTG